jgi:hypothetical protein
VNLGGFYCSSDSQHHWNADVYRISPFPRDVTKSSALDIG